MHTSTTHPDRSTDRRRTAGSMDLDAVAAVFRRNMAALVDAREARRHARTSPSHLPAA